MTDDVPDRAAPASDSGQAALGALAPLELDFQAFYLVHQEIFHSYAEVNLGFPGQAREAVHEAFREILSGWNALLQEGEIEQQAWGILRRTVARYLEAGNRPTALLVNGPIERAKAASAILRSARERLALMDGSRGLYVAIADLPPRQFDVVVLRFVVGYPASRIAWLLGIDERTVDYHIRKGKERLRVQLGLPSETDTRGVRP
ncbi:RNA polymerase sigma factor [Streptomyces sp. NPDC004031]